MYHSNACRTKSPTTRIAGGRWFSPLALFRIFLSKKGKFLQSRCFKKEFEQRQMGECIQDKIRLLPESYQTVLILYDLMEFSHQEIAEVVDISVEMGANLIDAGGLWIEIKFFAICLYAPAEQPPPKLAEANKILFPMINRSSGHQNQQTGSRWFKVTLLVESDLCFPNLPNFADKVRSRFQR